MSGGGSLRQSENVFLRAMSAPDAAALAPFCETVLLAPKQTLCEAGEPFELTYLPTSSVVSILLEMSDGEQVEVRSVGNESIVGVMGAIAASRSETVARVQIGGEAVVIPAARLRARAMESPSLMRLALRFAHANLSQTERTVACRSLHPLAARLARWLLISQDRVGADTLRLSQGYMGVMTGALRSSVSLEASRLKREGVIDYARACVRILDRDRLMRTACECYRADLTDRLRLQGLSDQVA